MTTTVTIGELDIESAAKEVVGNWMEFDCFSWDRSQKIEDSDQFESCTHKIEIANWSEMSNAEAIAETMKPFLNQDPCDFTKSIINTGLAVRWRAGLFEFFGTERSRMRFGPGTRFKNNLLIIPF